MMPDVRVILGFAVGAVIAILRWLREERNRANPENRRIVALVTPMGLMGACLCVFILSLFLPEITIAKGLCWSAYEFGNGTIPEGEYTALTEYLSGLEMYALASEYHDSSVGLLCAVCDTPEGTMSFLLFDRTIRVYGDRSGDSRMYYLTEDVDWDYPLTLLPSDP